MCFYISLLWLHIGLVPNVLPLHSDLARLLVLFHEQCECRSLLLLALHQSGVRNRLRLAKEIVGIQIFIECFEDQLFVILHWFVNVNKLEYFVEFRMLACVLMRLRLQRLAIMNEEHVRILFADDIARIFQEIGFQYLQFNVTVGVDSVV